MTPSALAFLAALADLVEPRLTRMYLHRLAAAIARHTEN